MNCKREIKKEALKSVKQSLKYSDLWLRFYSLMSIVRPYLPGEVHSFHLPSCKIVSESGIFQISAKIITVVIFSSSPPKYQLSNDSPEIQVKLLKTLT